MMAPIEFGRMWRKMIRELDAPLARAASTNSFSFSDSTWPRTMRAMYVQLEKREHDDDRDLDVDRDAEELVADVPPQELCSSGARS